MHPAIERFKRAIDARGEAPDARVMTDARLLGFREALVQPRAFTRSAAPA